MRSTRFCCRHLRNGHWRPPRNTAQKGLLEVRQEGGALRGGGARAAGGPRGLCRSRSAKLRGPSHGSSGDSALSLVSLIAWAGRQSPPAKSPARIPFSLRNLDFCLWRICYSSTGDGGSEAATGGGKAERLRPLGLPPVARPPRYFRCSLPASRWERCHLAGGRERQRAVLSVRQLRSVPRGVHHCAQPPPAADSTSRILASTAQAACSQD
ncbi:unnamed protein product [Rangifer tarandus platyrhynchus]|uniref:Uncharacterized protein n=1 Tax=Rangifer tarandus platyrhynchus TaxID=3082113 RepID=A0ABN8YYM7_RANTA|nr:unnamed protein product [Rangifer tarandus platyrhynchus]